MPVYRRHLLFANITFIGASPLPPHVVNLVLCPHLTQEGQESCMGQSELPTHLVLEVSLWASKAGMWLKLGCGVFNWRKWRRVPLAFVIWLLGYSPYEGFWHLPSQSYGGSPSAEGRKEDSTQRKAEAREEARNLSAFSHAGFLVTEIHEFPSFWIKLVWVSALASHVCLSVS